MRRSFRRVAVLLLLVLVAIQFVRPTRENPPVDSNRTLAARHLLPAGVAAALDRACRDCHSNETRWPWYSHLAPVSWFVIDHVQHGRRHFNYSEWDRYDSAEAWRLPTNACRMTRERTMPLVAYTLMHRTARLQESEIVELCNWTSTLGLLLPILPSRQTVAAPARP